MSHNAVNIIKPHPSPVSAGTLCSLSLLLKCVSWLNTRIARGCSTL